MDTVGTGIGACMFPEHINHCVVWLVSCLLVYLQFMRYPITHASIWVVNMETMAWNLLAKILHWLCALRENVEKRCRIIRFIIITLCNSEKTCKRFKFVRVWSPFGTLGWLLAHVLRYRSLQLSRNVSYRLYFQEFLNKIGWESFCIWLSKLWFSEQNRVRKCHYSFGVCLNRFQIFRTCLKKITKSHEFQLSINYVTGCRRGMSNFWVSTTISPNEIPTQSKGTNDARNASGRIPTTFVLFKYIYVFLQIVALCCYYFFVNIFHGSPLPQWHQLHTLAMSSSKISTSVAYSF